MDNRLRILPERKTSGIPDRGDSHRIRTISAASRSITITGSNSRNSVAHLDPILSLVTDSFPIIIKTQRRV
ncbi:unnamed protein product [Citrullus colocynthis]|uniref:Uncharacterized protein n=1 Tax=Citrullus colocynthis TaxID=252529 RepID=A0ABP0YF37_9ROSI